jgi:predicted phosphate transport protein (TIGR00153 family)
MKFRLLPKEEKFFELFKQQVEKVKEGVEALQNLVDNYTDVEKKYLKIRKIEHDGDNITHTIFSKLKTSFITPIDREDIHELASGLDDILDCIEGVASRLNYFKIKNTTPELKKLVNIIDEAVHQIYQAVGHLEKLKHPEIFCQEVNKLENKADIISQEATSALFQKTENIEQLKDLIKWKEIYNRLEIAADRCEDVANVIEGISIKNA